MHRNISINIEKFNTADSSHTSFNFLDPNQLHMEFHQVHVLKVNKKLVQPNLEVLVKSHPMIVEDGADCVIFAVPLKQLMYLNATLFVP